MLSFSHIRYMIIDYSLWHDEDLDDLIALAVTYHCKIYGYVPNVWEEKNTVLPELLHGYDILYGEQLKDYSDHNCLYLKKDEKGVHILEYTYASLREWIDAKYQYDVKIVKYAHVLLACACVSMLISVWNQQFLLTFGEGLIACFICLIPRIFGVKGSGMLTNFIDGIF